MPRRCLAFLKSEVAQFPIVRLDCSCVACSPCGRYIACGTEGDIVIAKTSSGEIIQRLQGHSSSPVSCVAFGRRSKGVVSGSMEGPFILREWELSENSVRVFAGLESPVSGVTVADDGRIFSSSFDNTVRIWDATTTAQICILPQSSDVDCVAVCGQGKMVAFGLSRGTLKVVDSVTPNVLFEEKHGVSCVSFSPKGSYLTTGSWDGNIRVWSTRTWTREGEHLEGHEDCVTCVSFRPDGKRLVSSSHDGTIRVWDVESGRCVGISPKIVSRMTSVSFTVDGQRIVSGSRDGIVRIWDARLGSESKENSFGHSDSVMGVTISADGLRVASASSDGTVRLWDTQAGEQLGVPLEGHTGAVCCVSFSPDGRQLVSGSFDETMRLWDTGMRTQIGDPFHGHTSSVFSVSFSFDGLRIVSGSRDGTVRIWNAETHEQIGDALQRSLFEAVGCVSESSNGRHVVSRTEKKFTTIWNRDDRSIVWRSRASGFENNITNDDAESIIRSCGQQAPHLWSRSFPAYTAQLYCVRESVYSNLPGDKTLLADTLVVHTWKSPPFPRWSYHAEGKVIAAGQKSGAIAICKLIVS